MGHRTTALVILAIACLALAPSLLAHDWPHWRGPRSNGVGSVSNAPERWSPSEGVSWRAEIEGYGISSPVIVANRIYVTTAITAQQRPDPRLVCDYLIGCLAVLGIPILLRYRWRLNLTKASEGRASFVYRCVCALDLAVFALLAVGLLAFATLMALGPNALDVGLSALRDLGVWIARRLGRDRTNLWFLNWDEANRHNTWIISSAMALVSLASVPFLFPTHRWIRMAGSAALVAGVAVATACVPWAVAYGDRFPTGALIVLYSPVAALAAWHVVGFLANHHAGVGQAVTTKGGRLAASVPALLSITLFVPPNYLYQREMVTRRLICLDAATGSRLWHTDVFSTPPATKAAANSDATPTPIVWGDTIVMAFGPGIAAVNLDGRLLWSRMSPDWIESSIYGAASSPVTDGKAVFVTIDGEYEARHTSRVVAYALKTGEELWSDTPDFAHDGYATPVVYDDGHRKLLLAFTSRTLVGYVIANGTVAWRLALPVSQPIPTPVIDNGRVYVTGGVGSDGYTGAFRPRQDAAPEELWVSRERADVSSPVLYRGKLFTISSTGVMLCYDAESGRILWKQRVGAGLGAFYASLVAADDKVYAVRSNGTTYVIAAEDKFRLISESSLPEEAFASPAFSGSCLVLRTVAALYCISGGGSNGPDQGEEVG